MNTLLRPRDVQDTYRLCIMAPSFRAQFLPLKFVAPVAAPGGVRVAPLMFFPFSETLVELRRSTQSYHFRNDMKWMHHRLLQERDLL
jgi:hypothetical protein